MGDIRVKDKYTIKDDLLYTKDSEWVKQEGDVWIYGVSNYASVELGELAYVELPSVGDTFSNADSMGIIEALKAVVDFYAPFDCEVVEVNEALEDDAAPITDDCYGEGWILKLKLTNGMDHLLNAEDYIKLIEKLIEEGTQ
ncbi:MAG: glycine cleavage system protein H [Candidatus Heimdallarchaeaceae archaeon]|jgi:glycine cleavage system H protein